MPDASPVFAQVESILVGMGVPQAKIQEAADLKKDLGLDSFSAVEIGFALEETFSIKISDEDMLSVRTVGDLVNAVQGKVQS
jgi:acyl carrier protein